MWTTAAYRQANSSRWLEGQQDTSWWICIHWMNRVDSWNDDGTTSADNDIIIAQTDRHMHMDLRTDITADRNTYIHVHHILYKYFPAKRPRHRASTSTRWHFTFTLCCHSNETRALIANLPNSAQLGSTPYHSAKLHQGPCNSVGMWRGTDRLHELLAHANLCLQYYWQTQTHKCVWPMHISPHAKRNENEQLMYLRSQVHIKTYACKPLLERVWCAQCHQSLAETEQVPG